MRPIVAAFWLLMLVIMRKECHGQDMLRSMFEMASSLYFNETFRDTVDFLPKYDFIVIGAGSSGSAVAGRLTEMKNRNILLLEAGGEETMLTDVPLTASINQMTGANWGYKTDPSPIACVGLEGGVCNWPKGRVVGGTSVLNYLVYNRGHRRDYDEWASLGNYGWSYKEVLPYFKKLENVKIPELRKSPYRGTNGPVTIEQSKFQTKLLDAFLQAGKSIGYKINDPNGAEQLGFSKIQATMRDGRRCSAAKAYLRPHADKPNFHLSMRSWVTKILIDPQTKTAIGVEFLKNKKKYIVRVKKEIVLSAGAVASPQLLMMSGVGPKEHLEKFDIPVIENLKVGYNFHDHMSLPALVFTINKPISVRERDINNPQNILEYLLFSRGPFTMPGGSEGYAFVKIPNSTLPADYPDMEIVMGPGGMNADDSGILRKLLGITDEFYNKVFAKIKDKHSFSLVPVMMRPKSRGRISLKSKNPFKWPHMVHHYNQDKDDVKVLIEGIKFILKLVATDSFQKYGAQLNPTPYLGCEKPLFGSDKYWECCIRRIGTSLQHQVGTCKMGPSSDPDAVVNPELQVHGIKNLRVADVSIVPVIPAAHTNVVAFMIGEKAADMIKDTWRNSI